MPKKLTALALGLVIAVAAAARAGDVHQPPLAEPTPTPVAAEPIPVLVTAGAGEPGLVGQFAAAAALFLLT